MSTLDIQRQGPVARVFMNRPELRNAFNSEVIADLHQAFGELGADPDVRAIVLGGHGKAFCAGGDLNWMRAMADFSWAQNRDDAQALADMLDTVYRCPKPVLGRIQGDCYAGAVGLAAVCDIVVAAEGAHFCISEAKVGLLPGTISPYVLRALGEQACRRYFLTAERFSAIEAHRLGFVHQLASAEGLDAAVDGLLSSLLANSPAAVVASKRLVLDFAGQPLSAELRTDSARRIADIRASAEGKEGVAAFLQKRAPAWNSAR